MRVKIFNSIKYLTSTPATTLTIAKESYEPPSEKDSPDFSMPYQITFQKSYWLIVARLGWSAWNLENKSLKLQQPPWVLLNVPFAALCNLSPHVTWKDPFAYKSNRTTMLNLSGWKCSHLLFRKCWNTFLLMWHCNHRKNKSSLNFSCLKTFLLISTNNHQLWRTFVSNKSTCQTFQAILF